MYKILIKISAFIFLISFNSCSDGFLEEENKNNLTQENFYQTREDFWMALNSCYPPLADRGMYGLEMQFLFGSFEDRILFETPGLDRLSINSSFTPVLEVWRALYFGLYRTSMLLKMLNERQDVEGLTNEMRNNYIAQAKALRGVYLFYLVVMFDEPIFYDENSIPQDAGDKFTNGKPEQFWDLLKADFLFGIENEYLPVQYGPEDAGRVTIGMAQAMLAKAMMFKHYYYHVRKGQKGSAEDLEDLVLAKQMLENVINSNTYRLIKPLAPKNRIDYINAVLCNTSFVDLPGSGNNSYKSKLNDESVWEILYSDDRIRQGWLPGWQWTGTLNFAYFSPHNSSFRNHEAHPDLWSAFETDGAPAGFDRDPRAYATLYLDNDTMDFRSESPYYNVRYRSGIHNKRIARGRGLIPTSDNPFPATGFGLKKYYYPIYYQKDAPLNDPVNRRMVRFADVLLMYAEVTHLLGESTDAGLNALNRVRARVDMPPVAALTKEAIIHERDVELALEGHRWFDLIRWSFDPDWGIDVQQILDRQLGPSPSESFFVKGKHEFMPIPIREINLNDGRLRQNPGW
jgi:starch-binding outer membrane protein, SusD/RagB family